MGQEFSLGELEYAVMLAVLRLGNQAYGVPIRDVIKERTKRDRGPGAIYTTLDRLTAKGFLTRREGEPTPERGGRSKVFFNLTGKGQRALSAAMAEREALTHGLGSGLLPQPQS